MNETHSSGEPFLRRHALAAEVRVLATPLRDLCSLRAKPSLTNETTWSEIVRIFHRNDTHTARPAAACRHLFVHLLSDHSNAEGR